jgi:glycosyltransferase involved in cell wall biosynthesis
MRSADFFAAPAGSFCDSLMNILYLCSDTGIPVLGRHGAAVHIRSLIGALMQEGHRVTLVAPLLNKSPWEEQESVAATVVHLPASGETAAATVSLRAFHRAMGQADNPLPGVIRRILYNQEVGRYLQGQFADNTPDFIYERASLFGTAGVTLARAWNRPLVVELVPWRPSRRPTESCSRRPAPSRRRTLSQADLVLVVSAELRGYAIELGADPDRVHVVPNGVNPTVFRPRSNDSSWQSQTPKAGPVLGFVGGLRPWHGVGVLPALLERLSGMHRGVRLVIAGDGPLRGELEGEFERRTRGPGFASRDRFPSQKSPIGSTV